MLFASKGEVPEGDHLVPFGVARIAREGSDLTIASAGQLVHRALEAAEILAAEGIECEVIDLRTIMPLDVDTVAASVGKTHRLLIVDEGYAMCGVGAELGQAMNELAFDQLDAPVARLHTDPVVHPLAPALERAMLIDAGKIVDAARNVVAGRPPVPWHWRNPGGIAPTIAAQPQPAPRAESVKPAPAAETVSGEPITMPFGDLTISEGKIVRWAKAVGDAVKAGELVAEIETDKAVVEIEAPVSRRARQHRRAGGSGRQDGRTNRDRAAGQLTGSADFRFLVRRNFRTEKWDPPPFEPGAGLFLKLLYAASLWR